MRTIGLLGGMSWESSIEYERLRSDWSNGADRPVGQTVLNVQL